MAQKTIFFETENGARFIVGKMLAPDFYGDSPQDNVEILIPGTSSLNFMKQLYGDDFLSWPKDVTDTPFINHKGWYVRTSFDGYGGKLQWEIDIRTPAPSSVNMLILIVLMHRPQSSANFTSYYKMVNDPPTGNWNGWQILKGSAEISSGNYAELVKGTYSAGNNHIYPWAELVRGSLDGELDNIPESIIPDPGGNSEAGGGGGTFNDNSDPIDFPPLPGLSATDTGLMTIYAPTEAQMKALGAYLFSKPFDDLITNFKKIFANPMDVIIGASIVPVAVESAGAQEIKVGSIGTGVLSELAASQYAKVDCGSITISEYWGSALDYSPYTKISIYLPYIGTRELNTDDVMGKTIHLMYYCDLLTGNLTAMIKAGTSVLYTFSGACSASLPLASNNFTEMITAGMRLAGSGIALAASGGASAPMSAAKKAAHTRNTINSITSSTANAVSGHKSNVQRSGAISGPSGMLGVQIPYLIIELPRQNLPIDYAAFLGFPSNINARIGDLKGYTVMENLHLDGVPATDAEKDELESILMGGFIA